MESGKNLVVGVGKVEGPLVIVLEQASILKLDIEPRQISGPSGMMHVYFPCRSGQFVSAASGSIQRTDQAVSCAESVSLIKRKGWNRGSGGGGGFQDCG